MSNHNSELVSVILPAYSGGLFIEKSIISILEQTHESIELVIIDDCSTDNVLRDVLKKYKHTKNIRIIRTPKRLGYGGEKAFNYGIKYANGSYIAKMDADDVSLSSRIEVQLNFLKKNPDIFLVGTNLTIIDEVGTEIGHRDYPESSEMIHKSMYLKSCIANPSIMFRGPVDSFYKIKYDALNDYYTFYSMLREGKRFHNIQQRLLKYRIHRNSTVFGSIKKNWKVNMMIKREIFESSYIKPSLKDRFEVFVQDIIIKYLPETAVMKIYSLRQNK